MKSFSNKEKIVALGVFCIIFVVLGFKFLINNNPKSRGMVVELASIIEDEKLTDEYEIEEEEEEENLEIMVHISGQVYKPGIIVVESGKRLIDAVELAGGLKSEADLDMINLAKKLSDEEKIYIPKIGEEANIQIIATDTSNLSQVEAGKTNINNCTKEELIKLPGIGEVIAERIIQYREINLFTKIEDIKSVSGIGDKKFEAIKELIIVK